MNHFQMIFLCMNLCVAFWAYASSSSSSGSSREHWLAPTIKKEMDETVQAAMSSACTELPVFERAAVAEQLRRSLQNQEGRQGAVMRQKLLFGMCTRVSPKDPVAKLFSVLKNVSPSRLNLDNAVKMAIISTLEKFAPSEEKALTATLAASLAHKDAGGEVMRQNLLFGMCMAAYPHDPIAQLFSRLENGQIFISAVESIRPENQIQS